MSLLRLSLLTVLALGARADVALAPLFGDHAVLQRDKPVPVWGRADADEHVTVTFGGQSVGTTAGSDGRWIVFLEPMPASAEGATLTVAGKNTLALADILVGEVWLCSGQSNMEFAVKQALNSADEIAAANFPLIRHVKIARTESDAPADTVKTTGWLAATPQTAGDFTAVGYFFARDLFKKLGVPVGLVHSSWGGTPVEAWMSPAALASDPAFAAVGTRWQQTLADFPVKKPAYDAKFGDWRQAEAAAKASGAAAHATFLKQRPWQSAPRGPGDSWTPTGLFNGMIHPLLPYALRGALWYQGESNTDHAVEYRALFSAMICAWRAHFGQGDFPFYFVQLANFKAPFEIVPRQWPRLREAQAQTLALPATGMAVAIDLGDPNDIHPKNKQDVGRRLALLAKAQAYGIPGDSSGPVFASATREGAALRVHFLHADTGLVTHAKPVQSLQVAGADKIFHPATARLERDTLLVSSPAVREPVAVRYAWENSPAANLYNGAGLPAAPFRSDDW